MNGLQGEAGKFIMEPIRERQNLYSALEKLQNP
jgi:hypothetical protein